MESGNARMNFELCISSPHTNEDQRSRRGKFICSLKNLVNTEYAARKITGWSKYNRSQSTQLPTIAVLAAQETQLPTSILSQFVRGIQ
jgi:hypothetical protein